MLEEGQIVVNATQQNRNIIPKKGYQVELEIITLFEEYYFRCVEQSPKPTNRRDLLISFINELIEEVKTLNRIAI